MTGVSRVQAPHVWEQYCLRRAIVASETDDGDANERLLWHGPAARAANLSRLSRG